MEKDNKKYSITNLSSDQLFLIISAVENQSRFNSGQIEHAFEDILWTTTRITDLDDEGRIGRREFFNSIKKEVFPELSPDASYGIGNAEEDDKLAKLRSSQYDLYRHLRFLHTKENNKEEDNDTWSVYDTPGMYYSDDERVGLKVEDTDE